MTKKNRSVKVYGMSGYKYQSTPTIMLKGTWLKELGFDIGDSKYIVFSSTSCAFDIKKRYLDTWQITRSALRSLLSVALSYMAGEADGVTKSSLSVF